MWLSNKNCNTSVKWAKKDDGMCYWYECSNCGGEVPKNKWGGDWFSCYCPTCGKPMDDDVNEEVE